MSAWEEAYRVIERGGLVVAATETFYAIAADPCNPLAVKKVFDIKKRASSKPLPLIASDIAAVAQHICEPHPLLLSLMNRFWPGSMTIVMTVDLLTASGVRNAEGKIAVRVPPDCPARRIAALAGGWITATSANVSGEPPPDTMASVSHHIRTRVDMVLDTGATRGGKPSTIIEIFGPNGYRILREGAIGADLIADWYKRLTQG
ncbi:MAG: L-threonylcarbamoyladenylate synthase [Desulfomonilaceae bacterium]